jgi:hypothetical protein
VTRVTVVSVFAAVLLLVVVLELVRRRRLQERYALLWLATMLTIVILALWPSALHRVSSLMGIAYPPSALFVLASCFFLVMLLHFSVVLSRLSRTNVELAQRLALLEERRNGSEPRADA